MSPQKLLGGYKQGPSPANRVAHWIPLGVTDPVSIALCTVQTLPCVPTIVLRNSLPQDTFQAKNVAAPTQGLAVYMGNKSIHKSMRLITRDIDPPASGQAKH